MKINKEKLLEIIYIQELGRGRVTGRLWGFVAEVVTIATFLKVYDVPVQTWMIPTAIFCLFFINYGLGLLYDKYFLVHIENTIANSRNKELMEAIKK